MSKNKEISKFVEYYNQSRYHEGINNLTLADVYTGKGEEILATRKKTKIRTRARVEKFLTRNLT